MKLEFLFLWINRKASQTGFNIEILKEFLRTIRLTSEADPKHWCTYTEAVIIDPKTGGDQRPYYQSPYLQCTVSVPVNKTGLKAPSFTLSFM